MTGPNSPNNPMPEIKPGTDEAALINVTETEDIAPTQIEDTQNADLYTITPPRYTQSLAEGETTVAAEAAEENKDSASAPEHNEQGPLAHISPRVLSDHTETPRPSTPLHVLQERARGNLPLAPTGPTPALTHYYTETVCTAALIGVRECSILRDRPAIWLVKNKTTALSPLAASVLVKEGLIDPRHLQLLSQNPSARRDPTDPISAIFLGVYDTLNEYFLGLAQGPLEIARQSTPLLMRNETRYGVIGSWNMPLPTTENMPPAAKVAVETAKGILRICTASLKAPVIFSYGMTRGMHNFPKVYGEEVRQYENVTGLKSGMIVGAKSFGYGLGDGLLDLVAKPLQGAQQEQGAVGIATGFAKGIGNVICKPTAGASGLVGYPLLGFYKELSNIKLADDDECPGDLVHKLAEAEMVIATESDKLYVVREWCQTTMPMRLV
ncbi:hypothetical protein DE146DRAFT_759733 [Phaeosphaeria sp. MPI-PUGE-AT-0046c]|nr:hypothetical protein DE146DRAFT_759733 [Phaeosphaeria sp. MPI-PUGE-AT-0046c]